MPDPSSSPRWLAKGSPARERIKDVVARVTGWTGLGTLIRVDTDEPVVALTFDDGPNPDATPAILDHLAEHGAHATFFLVGKAAKRHPEIVCRMVAEGHAAANHSWDHPSFPLLKGRSRRLQLRWCQEALPEGAVRCFRPPWGHQDLGTRLDAARLGFRVVAWDAMPGDWSGEDAATLLERMESDLRPGSILAYHDALWATDDPVCRDRSAVVDAVGRLLERHAGRWRFVTVPELLRRGRPRVWPWFRPADLDWLRRQV